MAENPKETPTYGVYEELDAAEAPEYAGNLEREVCDWIEAVSGMPRGDEASVHDWLMDGSVLCAVVNAIQPGKIKKVNTSKLAFKQMENITYFMNTARDWGVPESSMFGTPDLYENKDMGSVISAIYSFGGAVQVHFPEFDGPKLGIAHAAQASDTKREKKVATQSGGLSGTLEQQSAHTAARQVAATGRIRTDTGGSTGGGYQPAAAAPIRAPPPEGADAAGLDADLKARQEARFDTNLEKEVCDWIELVTGEEKGDLTTHEWLKSGQVLCKLANTVKPGSIKKVNTSAMPFKQMENITFFMNYARSVQVPESSMFGTPDLFEDKNMGSVINCIFVFGGAIQVHVPEYDGPKLGVAMNVDSHDAKRDNTRVASQYEALSRNCEVERPRDGGIIRGAA